MDKFETFEAMYKRLWTLIYDILKVFNIELADPYKKEA